MFKYKKMAFNIIMIVYIIVSIIELFKYLFMENTIFGLYYLLITLAIIFLLVPCVYNYKKYYSSARISKIIIIVLLGIFDSFILEHILFKSIGYTDSSNIYINSIFIYKNIIKTIIYLFLAYLCILEFKSEKIIDNKNIRK